MRRSEFMSDDTQMLESMLKQIEFGTMIIPDIEPYGVPVSFCYQDDTIYFHGAKAGRKYELLKHNPKVSFSAIRVYSYIPSSFLHHTMIPTQFFFSVYMNGRFEVVNDFDRKKTMLKALVQKYEPQQEIDMDSKQFRGQERAVFMGVIRIEHTSIKAKFGQNLKPSDREQIIRDLRQRGSVLDLETIKMIRRYNHDS